MAGSSELRVRLESAVKMNQQQQQRVKLLPNNINKSATVQLPSIRLKTDFSNFS